MAHKLEEEMQSKPEEQPRKMRQSRFQDAKVKRPSTKRAITSSEGFERHERAVAGVKSEIARESKTKESPKRFMKQRKVIDVKKPKDDFSHLKL